MQRKTKTISIGEALGECAALYPEVFNAALEEMTGSRYVRRRSKLTEEDFQKLSGGWFLFDYSHPGWEKPVLEKYLEDKGSELAEQEVILFESLLKTSVFDIFRVVRVDRGLGLRLRRVRSGVEYEVAEKKGTYQLTEKSLIIGRIWHTGKEWQLASDVLAYGSDEQGDMLKEAEKIPAEESINAQILWQAYSEPVMGTMEEAAMTIDRFLRDHEAGGELTAGRVLEWLRETKKVEDTVRRCLGYMRLNDEQEFADFVEVLNEVWKVMPAEARGVNPKIGDWEPGEKERHLLEKLQAEMMEEIDPDSFVSQVDLDRAVEDFQQRWINAPREDEGAKTPRELVAAERAISNHPEKDWTVKLQLKRWGGVEEERINELMRAGNEAYRKGKLATAEDYFRQVAEDYEDVYTAWGNLGLVLSSQGRKQEALAALDRALEIEPGYELARENRKVIEGLNREGLMKMRQVVSTSVLRIGIKGKLYSELEPSLASDLVGRVPAVAEVTAVLSWLAGKPGKRVKVTPRQKMWPRSIVREVNSLLLEPEKDQEKITGPGGSHVWQRNSQLDFKRVNLIYSLLWGAGWAVMDGKYYGVTAAGEAVSREPVIRQYLNIIWAYLVEYEWGGETRTNVNDLFRMRDELDGAVQKMAPDRLADFTRLAEEAEDGWVTTPELRDSLGEFLRKRGADNDSEFGSIMLAMCEDRLLWNMLPWLGLAEVGGGAKMGPFESYDKYRLTPLGEIVLPHLATGQVAEMPQSVMVRAGRNDPCPCGSGRKYKKCCGT